MSVAALLATAWMKLHHPEPELALGGRICMQRSGYFSAAFFPLLMLVAGAQQALACGSGNILYEDKMVDTEDESWGWGEDPVRSVGSKGITWDLQPGVPWTTLNQTSLYNDFEVCAKIKMKYPEKSAGYAGVAIWGVDSKNNYTVDLFPADGAVGIYRAQNGKYLKPVPYFKTDAVKKEQGATNEISIVVVGKHAVLTVNGKKVKEFNGIPPAEGGLVGLDFGTITEDSGPSTITYWDFQVREPPPPEEAPAPSKKKT
jgi:hypothetical protein